MDARQEDDEARCGRLGCGEVLGHFQDLEFMGRWGVPTGQHERTFFLDAAFSRKGDVWWLSPSRKRRLAAGQQAVRRFAPRKPGTRAMMTPAGAVTASPHAFRSSDLPIQVECPACNRANRIC